MPVTESAARHRLARLGYRLVKGRPRIAGAEAGYMIVDADTNGVVAGSSGFGYELDLEDVGDLLAESSTR